MDPGGFPSVLLVSGMRGMFGLGAMYQTFFTFVCPVTVVAWFAGCVTLPGGFIYKVGRMTFIKKTCILYRIMIVFASLEVLFYFNYVQKRMIEKSSCPAAAFSSSTKRARVSGSRRRHRRSAPLRWP